MLEILAAPLAACLVLAGIHCYLGIHVLMREVIFVDLALAQVAAMGAAVGTLFGFAPHSTQAYLCALGFTVIGAAIFSISRFRKQRIPQEAIIGIVFAVSTAVTILILSKSSAELEEIRQMLIGELLFVDWPAISATLLIYAAVAVVHVIFRRPFLAITTGEAHAVMSLSAMRLWDFLFYATFGIVVTSSVQMAGVLPVFSFLIVPASCAIIFFKRFSHRLIAGWLFGMAGSAAGLAASALWDLPTGASVVTAFGALFLICAISRLAMLPRITRSAR